MGTHDDKKEKKGGFWSVLPRVVKGSSSAMGGTSSGLGSAGGFGGLFATKAGILGVVLGGATIAAGVGVIYNFIGSSSRSVYTPQLFQSNYIEEEARKAGMERVRDRNSASAEQSSLDMFREQAKKDGLSGLAAEAGDSSDKDVSDEALAGDNSAAQNAEPDPYAAAAGAGVPKLQAVPGLGSNAGGSGTNISGGPGGGTGGQSASAYSPSSGMGKTSAMKGSLASRVANSPKYTVSGFNKRGAFGQAKYAGNMGARASYSADATGARTAASQAFVGETSGNGDVGASGEGVGLQTAAGVSNGAGLKNNDPSLNSNDSTPPVVSPVAELVNDDIKKYTDLALYGMMAAAGLIFATGIFAKKANEALTEAATASALGPAGAAAVAAALAKFAAMKNAAMLCAIAAAAAAGTVIFAGIKLMGIGQKTTGIVYGMVGAALIYQAYAAYSGIGKTGTAADNVATLNKTFGNKWSSMTNAGSVKFLPTEAVPPQTLTVTPINNFLEAMGLPPRPPLG